MALPPALKRLSRATSVFRGNLGIALSPPPHATGAGTKGTYRRVLDSVRWSLARREVNENYYLYKLHTEGGPGVDAFMSSTEAMKIVARQLHGCEAQYDMLRDKVQFFRAAVEGGVRTPEILYHFTDQEVIRTRDGERVTWASAVAELEGETVFAKPQRGAGGQGSGYVRFEGGNVLFEGEPLADTGALHAGRHLLQRVVRQHEALAAFNPTCLNTMRIVTVEAGGTVTPLAGFLRIGAPGSPTDNWSGGGIGVALDLERGTLKGRGLYKFGRRPEVEVHPETGTRFDEYVIPFLRETLDVITAFHRQIGCVRSIGWDVAVEPEGPCIVEGNTYWNAMFFMAADHAFKAKYMRALGK